MDWPIERKVQWGLGITVVVLCGMGMIAYALIVSFVNTSNWVIHTHLVIESTQGARTSLDDAESAVRGYLLTQDESFLEPYELVKGRIPGIILRMQLLTSDNPAQAQKVAHLKGQVDRELALWEQMVASGHVQKVSAADQRKMLNEGQQIMADIRTTLRQFRLELRGRIGGIVEKDLALGINDDLVDLRLLAVVRRRGLAGRQGHLEVVDQLRRGDDEDDQQHEHQVQQRRDVQLGHGAMTSMGGFF